jgi:hypothetical protein
VARGRHFRSEYGGVGSLFNGNHIAPPYPFKVNKYQMRRIKYNATFDKKIYWFFFGTLTVLYLLSIGSWKQNYTMIWRPIQYNRTFVIVTGAEGSGTGFFALNLGMKI